MRTVIDGDIVLELPFFLECFLWHVAVGAYRQRGKREIRNITVSRNQVVPKLISERQRVHDFRIQNGRQRRVRNDELIGSEIVLRKVAGCAVLVVQSTVGLTGV